MKLLTQSLLAVLFAGFSAVANAQIVLQCQDCRNIASHPTDVRNFAYNQVRGPSSWMTMSQADRFKVEDSFGNTVDVDMNLDYDVIDVDFRDLEIDFATRLIMQIRIIYQNGDIESYSMDTADFPPDRMLPVGDQNTRHGGGTVGGGYGGGGEDGGSSGGGVGAGGGGFGGGPSFGAGSGGCTVSISDTEIVVTCRAL